MRMRGTYNKIYRLQELSWICHLYRTDSYN